MSKPLIFNGQYRSTARFLEDPDSSEENVFMLFMDNLIIRSSVKDKLFDEETKVKLSKALSELIGATVTLDGRYGLKMIEELDEMIFISYDDIFNFITDLKNIISSFELTFDDDIVITTFHSPKIK